MSKTVVLPQTDSPSVVASVSFWQAFRFWLKLGFISFGGPAGQIAMMHQSWWITDADLGRAIPARAQLLYGPAGPGGPAAGDLYRLADA